MEETFAITRLAQRLSLLLLLTVFASSASAGLIANGDFETGDLTGWSETGVSPSGWSVGTPALSGSFSAIAAGSGGFNNVIRQDLASGLTDDTTLTMQFSASSATTSSDRSLNLYLGAQNTWRFNLRIIDEGDDGDGDLQAFDNAGPAPNGFNTILNDISFDTTHTLTVNVTGLGTAGVALTADVDGNTSAPIQAYQSGPPGEISRIQLVNNAVAWTADKVTLTAVPEPSSLALFGLAGLALAARRRRA